MLDHLREVMQPANGRPGPGPLLASEFETVAQALAQAGLLPKPVAFEEFHVPAR